MEPHLKSRHRLLLIPLTLACFAFSPGAQAVVPAPDGGYPNGNTAAGTDDLLNNTTGSNNIALGFSAAYDLTAGDNNIDIANPGFAPESNTIRIGNQVTSTDTLGVVHTAHTVTFIAGISGAAVMGRPVFVNGNGQ